ncbi:hypothetical protein [Vibrio nigripulchritudo]|uniref:hypothetical protein n=1 Tax=Vibrio nigripulchritudo TaxID=28173 RepID=UPI000695EE00|nr:hypothetical protein [Vibrio nigripulchritudo]
MKPSIARESLTRNARYELKRYEETGQIKKTLWIPEHLSAEFEQLANICCENPKLTPAMLRDLETGRLASIERFK